MLDCNEATQLLSIQRFKNLTTMQHIKLSMHLMACKACKHFSVFNDLIDDSLDEVCSLHHSEHLSERKKEELRETIKENIEN